MAQLPADARSWSTADVAEWVRSLGPSFKKFEENFEFTTGDALLSCDDDSLSKLGISNFGARQSLLAAIKKLDATAGVASMSLGAAPLPPGYRFHAFISYRRMGGTNHLAALINAELTARGFKVFFDLDTLRTGAFDTAILADLRASCCDVFVLVPGTLDRCIKDNVEWTATREKDWLRLEIAEACYLKKAIIPVFDDPKGFPSTEGLPADMADFPRHNALKWTFELKKQCVNELVERIELAVKSAPPFASLPPARDPSEAPKPAPAPAPAPAPKAPAAPQPAELRVAAGASIMDAVRGAAPGQTVRLAPGRYKEAVVLEKEVHIVGPREAVLEWGEGNALQCKGPAAPSVKGITIRNTAPKYNAVWITGGSRAVLEGCDVSSTGLNGIEVGDEKTAPALRSNVVHDCGGGGINFNTLAKGTAEGNDVFGNAMAGIGIQTGADPVVRGNKVHDGKQAGILVLENGRGTVEGNDVFGNALSGIAIQTGADPVVRGNKIHDQKFGIYVCKGGKGTITGNALERLGPGPKDAIDVEADCTGCRLQGNSVR